VSSVFPEQSREITDQEDEQNNYARDVDREYDVVQPIEVVRVLCGTAEQEQRDQDEADADRRKNRV